VEVHDISQTLREGIAAWPGDPEFRVRWIQRTQDGKDSNVSAIDLSTHTGTHVDAPLHLADSAIDIAHIPVQRFIGPARVFSIPGAECIRAADLSILDWRGVERALFKTRGSRFSDTVFDRTFAYFDSDAAEFLAKQRILLVGTDAPSVDAFGSTSLPSHRVLLAHEIVILEGARLDDVQPGDYELVCLPLKLAGLDGSPVRAILWK